MSNNENPLFIRVPGREQQRAQEIEAWYKASLIRRITGSRTYQVARMAGFATFVYLTASSPARAAPGGPVGDFEEIGTKIWEVICKFIHSPIVAVIVAIAILALLVMMALNEDKGMLSTLLKIVIAAMAIIGLPSIIGLLGLKVDGC